MEEVAEVSEAVVAVGFTLAAEVSVVVEVFAAVAAGSTLAVASAVEASAAVSAQRPLQGPVFRVQREARPCAPRADPLQGQAAMTTGLILRARKIAVRRWVIPSPHAAQWPMAGGIPLAM
jgi:hypothetical protein